MDPILNFLNSPSGHKLIILFVIALIIFFITAILKRIIPRYITETSSRYKARKFANFTGYFVLFLAVLVMYSNQLTGLTVFLGVAGAGIAFALQEIIVSIAGYLAINLSNFYKVGDRVKLGGITGDVIDIGLLRTSVMETGDWVKGDLYNGKMVRIANSFIFKEPVFNYSGDFPFLWDEIVVPIKTNGDFAYAKEIFTSILEEVQGKYAAEAKIYWEKMTEKMMVEKARVEPMVHFTFDENWISFKLRYVVDFKARRTTKDLISTKVLNAINASEGRIEVASAAFEITAFPNKPN